MSTKYTHPTLVMFIKREYFAEIVARRKHIEYRTLSGYWLRRMEKVEPAPFNLHLFNGMTHPIPEATVRVLKVEKDKRKGEIRLFLGRVLDVKHWDRKREKPPR